MAEYVDGEPCVKKQKVEDSIFRDFLNDDTKLKELKNAVVVIRNGYSHMNLALQSIIETNACSTVSFSEATVAIKTIESAGIKGNFVAGSIFRDGMNVLDQYVYAKKVPKDNMRRSALAKLLKFLAKEDHSVLWDKNGQEVEKDNPTLLVQTKEHEKQAFAVRIAENLLSKLSVNTTYTVDSSYGPMMTCTCKDLEILLGKLGDTSYGCGKAWMGNADIITEDNVSVTITREDMDTLLESPSQSSVSSVESKTTEGRGKDNYTCCQIRAQTIVSSFYQQKYNREKMKTCLVPGIGISTEKLYCVFYDSEHDVLLVSDALSMWQLERIVTSRIVFLWLTLNYRLFCSGVTSGMRSHPSNFFGQVGAFLNVYKTEVTMPAHRQHTKDSSDDDWAIFEGAPMSPARPNSPSDVDLIDLYSLY